MKNIAIKGDGTLTTGRKIISLFTSLGAYNNEFRDGSSIHYYYINKDNNITYNSSYSLSEIKIIYESIEDYYKNQIINYSDI